MPNPPRQQLPSIAAVGATNPFMGLLPFQLWRKQKDFFVFSVDFLPIAAGATVTGLIAVEADADFLVTHMTYTATDAAGTTFTRPGPFLVVLRDGASGRNFFNQAQHIENVIGDAELPSYIFPKLIRASGTLEVTVTNQDGVNGFNLRIAFLGFKVYGYAEAEA